MLLQLQHSEGEHQNCAPVVCARIERYKQLPYRAALRHTQ